MGSTGKGRQGGVGPFASTQQQQRHVKGGAFTQTDRRMDTQLNLQQGQSTRLVSEAGKKKNPSCLSRSGGAAQMMRPVNYIS